MQDSGEKEKNYMKKNVVYTDEPMSIGKQLPRSFLPLPENLVLKKDAQKVTIALSTETLLFFKTQARRHKTPYQKMIRNLLDAYVEHFSPSV